MIELENALRILLRARWSPDTEKVDLDKAQGRILAGDLVSDIEMPPFDKAAMDGYAVNSRDESEEFRVTGVVAAGDISDTAIEAGQAIRIMTGAPMPPGSDQVVIREHSMETQGMVRFSRRDSTLNVCLRGEDLKPGDRVLRDGMRIGPAEIAAAAAAGAHRLRVYRVPRVVVLVTGSEIVPPGEKLAEGKIFDSNGASITAQLRAMSVPPVEVIRVPDDPIRIETELQKWIDAADVVILSGGVSMGDYDYVPGVMKKLGIQLQFTKVAMKPGKPTVFGKHERGYVFGLPGNPVSTFMVFEIMVKPFLYRMMGHDFQHQILTLPMGNDWRRRKARRTEFVPVRIVGGRISALEYHGSAHVFALTGAEGLMEVPAGKLEIAKESMAHVRLLGS